MPFEFGDIVPVPFPFTSLTEQTGDEGFAPLRAAEQTGRPLGTADFVAGLERLLGRRIARRAPGRKPAQEAGEQPRLL